MEDKYISTTPLEMKNISSQDEGRRQLEACQFADGKPGTKCVGANACAQIDLSKIGCGSCNGANACLFPVITDKISVEENSCNGFEACNWHFYYWLLNGIASNVGIGKGSW
jgi:hypothetical protein